mmetsp:Transcript_46586/g.56390  ORF Transcript_46586/g.56390 Transcript_46586/m.56390 type:complete len:168 (+) Transcript_46586:125-628(+)
MDDCVNDCDYHFVDGDYGENQHEEAYWFVNNRYEDASYAGLSFDADVKTLKPAAIPSPTTDTVTMCVMCNMLADDKITTNADDQVHDNVMILQTYSDDGKDMITNVLMTIVPWSENTANATICIMCDTTVMFSSVPCLIKHYNMLKINNATDLLAFFFIATWCLVRV